MKVSTALSAFKRGLLTDGALYMSLVKYAPITMEDAMLKSKTEIMWEKDEEMRLMITAARHDTTKRSQYDKNHKKKESHTSHDRRYDDKS